MTALKKLNGQVMVIPRAWTASGLTTPRTADEARARLVLAPEVYL